MLLPYHCLRGIVISAAYIFLNITQALKYDLFVTVSSWHQISQVFFSMTLSRLVIRHHPFTVTIQPVTPPVLRN